MSVVRRITTVVDGEERAIPVAQWPEHMRPAPDLSLIHI